MAAKSIVLLLCLSILGLSPVSNAKTPASQAGNSSAILLQGYHWDSSRYSNPNWYTILFNKVDELANLGVTHVWFPPPSDSAAPEGYLPRQLNILDSQYGSADDLAKVIRAFNDKGVKAVADIVVNHRVGTTNSADFTNPDWSLYSVVSDDECGCGLGNPDTGDSFGLGRDIDHTNVDEVQNGIIKWLNEVLKPVGFTGIRFDYGKGFTTSIFGKYANAFDSEFCVGEMWDQNLDLNNVDPHRQRVVDWVSNTDQSCGAFDFTTKGILNDALSNGNYWRLKASDGKPPGVIGWTPAVAVTFVDNHDTGVDEHCDWGQNEWPVPCDKIMLGYAYILTHPGVPTIYYPHLYYDYNLKDGVADLVKARRVAGVTSTSPVDIQAAEQELYAAIITGNSKQLAVKIGNNSWNPDTTWSLQVAGLNYAVWTK